MIQHQFYRTMTDEEWQRHCRRNAELRVLSAKRELEAAEKALSELQS